MAPSTPQVNENKPVIAANSETPITLDTPEWFDWLESATTFAFNGSSGNFIARKEARARGGWYWKAYHTVQGTLHRAYLGRSSDLTLDRLNSAAAKLTSTASVGVPKNSSVQTSTLAASPGATSALPSNLLGTKLIVPPARTQLVSRPRLFQRLEAGLKGKLTLVAAPAQASARPPLLAPGVRQPQAVICRWAGYRSTPGIMIRFDFGAMS